MTSPPPAPPCARSAPRRPRPVAIALTGIALLGATPATTRGGAPVRFVDVTAEVGIDFRHAASPTRQKYLPETMGAGVALLDADGDGRLDVFFVNGARLDDPMPVGAALTDAVKDGPRHWNRLYRQRDDGTFEDVTADAGLAGVGYGQGVAVGDYDGDGDADLYVTGLGANQLYRNEGGGRFADVTAEAGVAGGGWSTSAAFADLDADGHLDLFVARYMEWSFDRNPRCSSGYEPAPDAVGPRAYCHPGLFPGATALLYRNLGDGRFRDVSEAAGVADPEGKSLGVALADFDADGRLDLFVANDAVRQFLYRNRGGAAFEETAQLAFAAYDEHGGAFSGMGVDAADYDNDGRPDVVVTALANQRYALFRNLGDGSFAYATHDSGLGRLTLLSSGWGVRFLDVDNDGWKDLFVAQGHVLDTIESAQPHLRYREPPLLARNDGGRFRAASDDAGAVFGEAWAARGMAAGDLDDDGDLDVVISTLGGPARVLRNEGGHRGHRVQLRLVGTRSNRDGIGAAVRLVTGSGAVRHATVTTASSYLSASDPRVHLGLGPERTVASIEIRWPSGVVQRLEGVEVDRILTVTEPEAGAAGASDPAGRPRGEGR